MINKLAYFYVIRLMSSHHHGGKEPTSWSLGEFIPLSICSHHGQKCMIEKNNIIISPTMGASPNPGSSNSTSCILYVWGRS